MGSRPRILSRWHVLLAGLSISPLGFYESVERVVRERQLPGVTLSRVRYREGGLTSVRRLYLRIERRGFAFDICAAPYGTSAFVSWRLVRLGSKHPLLHLLGLLFATSAVLFLAGELGAGPRATLTLTALLAAAGLVLLARRGVFGPERRVLGVPYLGWLYKRLFDPSTYYAYDAALLFRETVRQAILDVVDDLLVEQGLQALSEAQRQHPPFPPPE